jgi:hypothetical protein
MQTEVAVEKFRANSAKLADELNQITAQGSKLLFPEGGRFTGGFRGFDPDQDSLHVTRAESNHDATVVIWEDADTGEVIPIFFKRINLDALHRELQLNAAMHERISTLETFEVIMALPIPGEKYAYFGTRLMHDLVPLSEMTANTLAKAEVLMRRGVSILKEMQAYGIYHQDPFPKNLAIRSSKPNLLGVAYDFEYGQVLNAPLTGSRAYSQGRSLLDKFKFEIHESSNKELSLDSLDLICEKILNEHFPEQAY